MTRQLALLLCSMVFVACAGEPRGRVPFASPTSAAPSAAHSDHASRSTPAAPVEVSDALVTPEAPAYEAPAAGVEMLRVGAAFSCLLRDGRVRCWGSNRFGQLGVSTLPRGRGAFSARPVEVEGLSDVRALALGSFHACALLGDGSLRCWGQGGFGQLGRGSRQDGVSAAPVADLERVSAVAAGEHHTCAIADDGVLCWGANDRGQLGRDAGAGSLAPTQVADLSAQAWLRLDAGVPVELGSGRAHSCVRMTTGAVYCWGEDVDGELGRGARSLPDGSSSSPAPVLGGLSASVLRVGWGHACAVTSDHRAFCWGRNDARQLGDVHGGEQGSYAATPVTLDLTGVVEVAPGAFHSCFLFDTGEVKCVGADHHGQLGDGGHRPHARPVDVAGLRHVAAIAAGESHSCALLASGEVRCWGNPHSGRVGPHADERARRQTSPVRVIAPRVQTRAP